MCKSVNQSAPQNWCVYIIESSDGRYYTGITTDMAKRWHAHTHTKQGAKFFRGRPPKQLLYVETDHNRSSASKREAAIKKLNRRSKQQLIDKFDSSLLPSLTQEDTTTS